MLPRLNTKHQLTIIKEGEEDKKERIVVSVLQDLGIKLSALEKGTRFMPLWILQHSHLKMEKLTQKLRQSAA